MLALERCIPLWQAAGLPQELSRSPDLAISVGREFIVATRHLTPDRHEPAATRALAQLGERYGGEVASAVSVWATRHFGRDPYADALWQWQGLFLAVANLRYGAQHEPMLHLPDERKQEVLEIIHSLGVASDDLHEREDAAAAIPLTAQENDVVGEISPQTLTDGYDPGISEASVAAGRELTLRTWRELRARLSEEDLPELLRWAREVAPLMRVDPQRLVPLD